MADFYDEEQVAQILRQALNSRSTNPQKLSREQVAEIAAELGVNRADFLAAEQQWLQQQVQNRELAEFDRYKRQSFRDGVLKYVIVNGFFSGISIYNTGHLGWAAYPLMIWGLGIALDAWATFSKNSSEYAKQFQKWQRKQQRDRLTAKITDKVTSTVSQWLQ